MHQTKLIKLLKNITPSEFKRLQKGVKSSFFTTNPHIPKLYTYLKKYYPDFKNKKLEKTQVYAHLYPKQEYKDNKLRKLFTEFTQIIESFLIHLELQNQPFEQQKLLTKIYGRRNMYSFFERNTNLLLKELANQGIENHNYFRDKMELSHQYLFHPNTPKHRNGSEILSNIMTDLDYYFIAMKLQMASELINRQNHLKEAYDVRFLDTINEELDRKQLPTPAFIRLYIKLLTLLKYQKNEVYWELREELLSIENVSIEDKSNILQYLMNYAIAKVNKGVEVDKYRKENFDLYKLGLEKKLLIKNERISDIAFTNIASFGASFNEFHWTTNFIEAYQQYLPTQYKNQAVSLSLGYLHFFQEEYEKSINILLFEKFTKVGHNRRAKGLLLRSYFELSLINETYIELFFSFIQSFTKFLYRDSVYSKESIKSYLNLVQVLQKIAKYINNNQWSNTVKQQILEQVKVTDMVLKPWLIKKIECL